MFSKRSICFLILCISLSAVVLLCSGCRKTLNNHKPEEKSEVTKSDKPIETEPNMVRTKIEENEPELEEPQGQPAVKSDNPVALIETSMGNVKIELFQKEAPVTVKNFIGYVNEKFYDGTIFHRVVPGFVIQGGGFTEDMAKKSTNPPIKNEAGNGISNTRGTVAMARTPFINSATSQFFINLRDNTALDHKDETSENYGYCVFGRVIDGIDVVDSISRVQRERKSTYENVPVKPVIIKSIRVL